MSLKLERDLRVETIDDEAIVLDRSGAVVHHVSADGAEVLGLVASGTEIADVPDPLIPAMTELLESGLIVSSDWSRRKLLKMAGASMAGAGIITVALASPAAAASGTATTELRKTLNGNNSPNPTPTQLCLCVAPTGNSKRGDCVWTRTENPSTISVTVTMTTGTSPPPSVWILQSNGTTCLKGDMAQVGTWGTPVGGPQTFTTSIAPGATIFTVVFFLSASGGGVDGWSSFPVTLA